MRAPDIKRMKQFFATGGNGEIASRPTVWGLTTFKDSYRVFMDLLDETEKMRKILADALERREIRERILEPSSHLDLGQLGSTRAGARPVR